MEVTRGLSKCELLLVYYEALTHVSCRREMNGGNTMNTMNTWTLTVCTFVLVYYGTGKAKEEFERSLGFLLRL